MPKLPNLFLVGAPKCGTSALHDYLGQHPDIFMSSLKELNFFCSDLLSGFPAHRKSPEQYLAYFREWGGQRYGGEGSVWYLFSKAAAQNIRRDSPQARIIIMLRNPVDMVYNLHFQHVRTGDESLLDFRAAFAAQQERARGVGVPRPDRPASALLQYSEVGKLSEQVARYLDAFDAGQVRVILFDDFARDTAGVYRDTLEFLGVDPEFKAVFARVNENRYPRSTLLWKLRHFPPGWLKRCWHALVPPSLRTAVLRSTARVNMKKQGRPPMDPLLRAELTELFAPDVRRLSALLQRDLSHWTTLPATPPS